MAFKFKIQQGLHVEESLFKKLCEARTLRLHGQLQSVEVVHVGADAPEELKERVGKAGIARVTQDGIQTVEHGHAVASEKFPLGDFFLLTTEKGCLRVKAYGDEPSHVGLTNFLQREISVEPERREAFKKGQAARPAPTPRSERFAKYPASGKFTRW